MRDYVTEMMKTAGIEEEQIACSRMAMNLPQCDKNECKSCKYSEYEIPDFTAEKQINIIKLLGKSTDLHYFGWGMSSLSESTDEGIIEVENDDFAQALAQLTTELMKAGELDKGKVREVLEG